MSADPIALIGPFGLPPGHVTTVARDGWFDAASLPRHRARLRVPLGDGIDVEVDHTISTPSDLMPDRVANACALGRGLLSLRAMATVARGPLGCIPKTLRLIRTQFGTEAQRARTSSAVMCEGPVQPLDLALSPDSPRVIDFRARVAELEAAEGGIFIDRLIEEAKVRPGDEAYPLIRTAADLLVATILTRTHGEGPRFFGPQTLNELIREIDGALGALVDVITRDPSFLTLERGLRSLGHVRRHRPVVVVQADQATLHADPLGVIEAAAQADVVAVGVLIDLAAGDPRVTAIARAARANDLPVAVGLPEAQCRAPELVLDAPVPNGVTLCAQHTALLPPYGPDTLPVRGFDYREPEQAVGGYRLRGSTAFVVAERLASGELDAPLADDLTCAYQYLDARDRVVWSEPVVGASGGLASTLRARGYLVLPFQTFDAEGRVEIVDPPTAAADRSFLDRVLREAAELDEEDLRRLYPLYFANLVGRDPGRRARAATDIAALARRDPLCAGTLRASRWLMDLAPLDSRGRYFGGLGLFQVAADARFVSGVHGVLADRLGLERALRAWDAAPLRAVGDAMHKVLFDPTTTLAWTGSTATVLGAMVQDAERRLERR